MTPRTPQRSDALTDIPLFAGCSSRELQVVLELGKVISIDAGERLMVEGKGARDCCVLLEGDAEVRAGGEVVAVLRRGSLVGELSLLTNTPRSATVVARTPVRALSFDGAAFNTLLADIAAVRERVLPGGTEPFEAARAASRASSRVAHGMWFRESAPIPARSIEDHR